MAKIYEIEKMTIEIPDERETRMLLYEYGDLECGHRIDYKNGHFLDLITEVMQVGFAVQLGFTNHKEIKENE